MAAAAAAAVEAVAVEALAVELVTDVVAALEAA